ncbi:MAG: hypothetical protein AAGB10_04545 [Pseudomonadota bacterium]
MTDQAPQGDMATDERLAKARAVYATIFRALQASLEKLETEEDTTGDARNRQELFRAHLKQFQSVFEIEGSLDKYGTSADAARLDLDAARAEISKRLAWIRERGTS